MPPLLVLLRTVSSWVAIMMSYAEKAEETSYTCCFVFWFSKYKSIKFIIQYHLAQNASTQPAKM